MDQLNSMLETAERKKGEWEDIMQNETQREKEI